MPVREPSNFCHHEMRCSSSWPSISLASVRLYARLFVRLASHSSKISLVFERIQHKKEFLRWLFKRIISLAVASVFGRLNRYFLCRSFFKELVDQWRRIKRKKRKKEVAVEASLNIWEFFPWSITLSTVLVKETNYREKRCSSACRIDSDVFRSFHWSRMFDSTFLIVEKNGKWCELWHLQRLAIRSCSSSFGRGESIFLFFSPVEVKFGDDLYSYEDRSNDIEMKNIFAKDLFSFVLHRWINEWDHHSLNAALFSFSTKRKRKRREKETKYCFDSSLDARDRWNISPGFDFYRSILFVRSHFLLSFYIIDFHFTQWKFDRTFID